MVSTHYSGSDALTFNVQDGKNAGQTVPHVHVHVIPRSSTDIFNSRGANDEIYEAINKSEKLHVDELDDATPRSREDMVIEAQQLLRVVESLL